MKYLILILMTFLIASAATVLGVFILELFGLVGTVDTDMKNLPYGIAVIFNLILALGTLPIFLNVLPSIRQRLLASGLSFFLLPLVTAVYLSCSLEEEALTGVGFCIPYFIVLSLHFVRFRNQTFAK